MFCWGQFVEERLDMLNAGLGFSDEFEFEAYNYTAKVSNSAINDQYNNWVSAMKKQGTAFFKTVKNKVSNSKICHLCHLNKSLKKFRNLLVTVRNVLGCVIIAPQLIKSQCADRSAF